MNFMEIVCWYCYKNGHYSDVCNKEKIEEKNKKGQRRLDNGRPWREVDETDRTMNTALF